MSNYVDNVADNLDRHILFNMPLRKAIALFSALLFIIVALSSSFAYYFSMRKILKENLVQELKQTLNTKQLLLKSEFDKEILILKVLSENSVIGEYFTNPSNEEAKKESFALLSYHKKYFSDTTLSWISIVDSNYYINGKLKEKYNASDPRHAWLFKFFNNKNSSIFNVGYDDLDNYTHYLFTNYPVKHKGNIIGIISSRISLSDFMNKLHLPENIFIFDESGTIVGAANEHAVKEKRTLKELLGDAQSEKIMKRTRTMNKSSSTILHFGNLQYIVNSTERIGLFFVIKDEINMAKIFKERATAVFIALLFIMLLVFFIFNKLISHILKPINKQMMSYIESSLLDELTKLPNRRFFNMRIEDEWNRAVRGKYSLSFLMLDIDRFKSYNDKYGHLEGDRLLRDVSRIFSYCVNRTSDFAARFGGEEFCVILPNTSISGAKKIAENIRISMERADKATISIGVACKTPGLEDNMQSFIDLADQKLYEAKNTGRNKVCG
ncbi:MAG: sensor domain-containing diguanylate cyclase [Fibromonadaceae bacterium]|jgi:diguanylate cyclase (GGDEF)-like protein|nr:sensor domain-containing diguanylate cyclase [Fibromonadaceae bacterium]